MTIREEFEKAFEQSIKVTGDTNIEAFRQTAIWSAKWMAERCAREADISHLKVGTTPVITSLEIRQLAKELDQ